ncbi:MAG: hypothetical protein NTV43_00210 [Methylococcales bacterium]|nr:hypothetical protein [Methylococcales bacterium]
MEIKLQRTLKIDRFRVKGTIAKAEKRPEIHSILLLAQEQYGVVSARDVAEKLLGGRPETVGRRLLALCADYELLVKEKQGNYFTLTPKGTAAISQQKIFVPEQGTWELWVTDDPLLPTALLKVEAFKEPSVIEEKRNKDKQRKFVSLPAWLRSRLIDKTLSPLVATGQEYHFIELAEKAEFVTDVDAHVKAIWITPESAQASLQFDGTIDKKNLDYHYQTLPKLAFSEIWQQMLKQQGWLQESDVDEQAAQYWSFAQQTLCIPYKDLSETEKSTFLKDYKLSKPVISGFGDFDDTLIDNIPIMPKDENAAGGWGFWLLEQKVNDYMLSGQLEKEQQNISALKQFAEFDLIFPEQQEFAQELRNSNPKAYWHLQAPLDWQL